MRDDLVRNPGMIWEYQSLREAWPVPQFCGRHGRYRGEGYGGRRC